MECEASHKCDRRVDASEPLPNSSAKCPVHLTTGSRTRFQRRHRALGDGGLTIAPWSLARAPLCVTFQSRAATILSWTSSRQVGGSSLGACLFRLSWGFAWPRGAGRARAWVDCACIGHRGHWAGAGSTRGGCRFLTLCPWPSSPSQWAGTSTGLGITSAPCSIWSEPAGRSHPHVKRSIRSHPRRVLRWVWVRPSPQPPRVLGPHTVASRHGSDWG